MLLFMNIAPYDLVVVGIQKRVELGLGKLETREPVDLKERMINMELNRYLLKADESELKEIERDLAEHLNVPYVRCSYDSINSHKHQLESEMNYRREFVAMGNEDYTILLDFIINYEIYDTFEEYCENNGGVDGEVYEMRYLKGNGNYIVILDI